MRIISASQEKVFKYCTYKDNKATQMDGGAIATQGCMFRTILYISVKMRA
jgi:predicted outer membrane repeat protein